jgi:hypothetical protein
MKAFFCASHGPVRSNQKPISRYEVTPMSSQHMNVTSRLLETTRPSMAAVKKDTKAK